MHDNISMDAVNCVENGKKIKIPGNIMEAWIPMFS